MIVVQALDPALRKAALRAADQEEDVVTDARLAQGALEYGFPRLMVREASRRGLAAPEGVPVLEVDAAMRRRWEQERLSHELPLTRLDHLTSRLELEFARMGRGASWADRTLAELARASGARLPVSLRSFGRRVMEFPRHYTTLFPLADACGTSRGALKARFRRRGLPSPSTYLRWFRILAVAEVLSERHLTVADAARRCGFTSDGNLCRMMANVTDMTPSQIRSQPGRRTLLLGLTWRLLTPEHLEGWAALDDIFDHRAA
ncbi:MAG: helix-turn-helix domain-containing protein [Gemmatimonadota bacterium]